MFLLPPAAVFRFGQPSRPSHRLTQMHADERRGNSAWVEFLESASQRKYSRGLSTSVETTVLGGSLRFRPRIGADERWCGTELESHPLHHSSETNDELCRSGWGTLDCLEGQRKRVKPGARRSDLLLFGKSPLVRGAHFTTQKRQVFP